MKSSGRCARVLLAVALLVLPHVLRAQFASVPRPMGLIRPFSSDRELAAYLKSLVRRSQRRYAWTPPPSCSGASIETSITKAKQPSGDVVIEGVVQSSGNALDGASVRVDVMQLATTTDARGAFRLVVPAHKAAKTTATLRLLRVGYNQITKPLPIEAGMHVSVKATMCQALMQLSDVVVTGASQITNVQTAGIDEGDVVKLAGDYLVILRRGRLFTVSLANRDLKPAAMANAYADGIDPNGTWYDELLVHDNRVVVIGYSYKRGGTEVGVFNLGRDGSLSHVTTFNLRSNDYYSSRNYASRLVGGKLVFYSPLPLSIAQGNPLDALPAMRVWRSDSTSSAFRRIVTAKHVFGPANPDVPEPTLHTVTSCDLDSSEVSCESTVLAGPSGDVYYVSADAAYVWATPRSEGNGPRSILYRLPLNGAKPTAIRVEGSPVDQFSFLASDDGFLNVLVRSRGKGDGMWRAELTSGDAALLRVPLARFSDGSRVAERSAYRPLPVATGGTFQNRFVGNYLLYGTGNGWSRNAAMRLTLFAVEWHTGALTEMTLAHSVDRIEVMGNSAVVVGSGERDLDFTGVELNDRPRVVQRYTMREAAQGELRSHGFFYQSTGTESGTLGLPVRANGSRGSANLRDGSASVLFLRNTGREFESLGELAALNDPRIADRCVASCVDWYGNARPVFIGDRVFALLGYELVEGAVRGNRIEETHRTTYFSSR